MCYNIHIEDLAANAMIESLKIDRFRKFISYQDMERYGAEVVKILSRNNEKAVLILSRDSTNDMFRNYSDIFEESFCDGSLGIKLKEHVTIEELINKFRGYLSWDVLLAFINEQTVAMLGV